MKALNTAVGPRESSNKRTNLEEGIRAHWRRCGHNLLGGRGVPKLHNPEMAKSYQERSNPLGQLSQSWWASWVYEGYWYREGQGAAVGVRPGTHSVCVRISRAQVSWIWWVGVQSELGCHCGCWWDWELGRPSAAIKRTPAYDLDQSSLDKGWASSSLDSQPYGDPSVPMQSSNIGQDESHAVWVS